MRDCGEQCCKRKCLTGGIPTRVLEAERGEFAADWCGSQVDRKRFILVSVQSLLSILLIVWQRRQTNRLSCLFYQRYRDEHSHTSFSVGHHQYPICWRAMTRLFGCSRWMLQNVAETPKAR